MKKYIKISNKIKPFNKSINIEGDKSLSIRWALLASQARGKSTCLNLLRSEDVISTLNCLKKLGTKIRLSKNTCEIIGNGLNGFKYKKKILAYTNYCRSYYFDWFNGLNSRFTSRSIYLF